MEATGSYWKCVWRALEGEFELTLANPAQIKNLAGRKSDRRDANWMVDLHAHGLIRGSFVPPAHIDALRELTRTRKQHVRAINRHNDRIQKILDIVNIKMTVIITYALELRRRHFLTRLKACHKHP